MSYKDDLREFLSHDTSQAFLLLFVCFTTLLISNQIDKTIYTELMRWNIIGFFGEKLTNFKGMVK